MLKMTTGWYRPARIEKGWKDGKRVSFESILHESCVDFELGIEDTHVSPDDRNNSRSRGVGKREGDG